MATLSTTAWVLHDIGLATAFGGTLFGKLALHPSVKAISSPEERGQIVNDAWTKFNWMNAIGLTAAGLSWLVGRRAIGGQLLGRKIHSLVRVNDALMAGSVASGFGAIVAGQMLGHQEPRGRIPLEPSSAVPASEPRAHALERLTGTLGTFNLLLSAALIGTTTVLAMQAGRSARFSLLGRILP